MITLDFKLFFKCKVTLFATLIYLALLGYSFYYGLIGSFEEDGFTTCMSMRELTFLYFLVISYYFFSKAKQDKIEEVIFSVKSKTLSSFMSKGICLMTITIIICAIMFAYQLFHASYLNIDNKNFLIFIFLGILIHHIPLYFFAILLGRVISFAATKIKGYFLLYLIYFTFGTVIVALLNSLSLIAEWTYPLANLFAIYKKYYNNSTNYYYIYSIEPINIYRISFWIFLMLLLLSFQNKKQRAWLKRGLCLFGTALSLFLFLLPDASVNYDISSSINDVFYNNSSPFYHNDTVNIPEPNFKVLDYTINFNIYRTLDADVTVKVDNPQLDTYDFTLNYKYKIRKITNQNGTSLDYTRDGDYVTIYLPKGETAEQLNFSYVALSATKFYSTSQGIFLPGYHAYYPMPGKHPTVVFKNEDYHRNISGLGYKTSFHGKINTKVPLYSNLDIKEDGSFSGETSAFTLLGSHFATEHKVGGCRIICPSFDYFESDIEEMATLIETYKGTKHALDNKIIFIAPYEIDSSYVYVSDEYLISVCGYLPERYDHYVTTGELYPPFEVDEELLEMIEHSQQMVEQEEQKEAARQQEENQ